MATNKGNTIPISLQPWPKQNDENENLKKIAERIHRKYGGLRHITEEELRAQISQTSLDSNGTHGDVSAEEDKIEAESQKGTPEYITANGRQMLQYLGAALNDTLMLLDFTSLLESTYQRKQGESTMSAMLKQKVAPGTLAFDEWENMPAPTLEKLTDDEKVAKGARMESLTSSADTLLKAAQRLENDVKEETKFWEQVLSVDQKGWTFFRSPLDRRHLGVQVSSIEAGPLFRGQGLVSFEPDSEGDITLKHIAASEPKMVRVRLEENGKVIGASRLSTLFNEEDTNDPLHDQVLRARDSLFEEELFHEMMVETRSLLSIGVKVREKTICIPLENISDRDSGSSAILVDLVTLGDGDIEMKSNATPDEFAQSVVLSLRILLSNLHRQRLHRRTSRPQPLSDNPRTNPPSAIIRPLMKFIQHQSALLAIQSYVTNLSKVLRSAGLTLLYDSSPKSTATSDNANSSSAKRTVSNNDGTSEVSLSSIFFFLPSFEGSESDQGKVAIDVYTNLSQAPFTTSFAIHLPRMVVRMLYGNAASPARRFEVPSVETLCSMLGEVVALDIAYNVLFDDALATTKGWTVSPGETVLIREEGDETGNGMGSISVNFETELLDIKLCLSCESTKKGRVTHSWMVDQSGEKTLVERVEDFVKADKADDSK
jgi:mediator of RNA polymerase II transcription subunit 17, fungi type